MRKGKVIYTKQCVEGNYKIWMFQRQDEAKMKVSYGFYLTRPDNRMSEIDYIGRRVALNSKTALDFMQDYICNLTQEEMQKIEVAVSNFESELEVKQEQVAIMSAVTPENMHQIISDYIRKFAETKTIGMVPQMYIRKGYGIILTKDMDMVVKDLKEELNMRRNSILDYLKIMDALDVGKERIYDNVVKIHGKTERCYKIKLVEPIELKIADEEIEEVAS